MWVRRHDFRSLIIVINEMHFHIMQFWLRPTYLTSNLISLPICDRVSAQLLEASLRNFIIVSRQNLTFGIGSIITPITRNCVRKVQNAWFMLTFHLLRWLMEINYMTTYSYCIVGQLRRVHSIPNRIESLQCWKYDISHIYTDDGVIVVLLIDRNQDGRRRLAPSLGWSWTIVDFHLMYRTRTNSDGHHSLTWRKWPKSPYNGPSDQVSRHDTGIKG